MFRVIPSQTWNIKIKALSKSNTPCQAFYGQVANNCSLLVRYVCMCLSAQAQQSSGPLQEMSLVGRAIIDHRTLILLMLSPYSSRATHSQWAKIRPIPIQTKLGILRKKTLPFTNWSIITKLKSNPFTHKSTHGKYAKKQTLMIQTDPKIQSKNQTYKYLIPKSHFNVDLRAFFNDTID